MPTLSFSRVSKAVMLQGVALVTAGLITSFFIDPRIRPFPIMLSAGIALMRVALGSRKTKAVSYGIDEDLIYLVTHMYAISTGKPPNKRLFMPDTWAGGYGAYDSVLKRIAVLAVDWGYGFARAIRIVARDLKNKVFRDFLLRLGELLGIGEDPSKFLDIERRALLTEFQAHYSRILEASKMLLGIYTSSVSSAIFIMITFMIFVFLFPVSPTLIVLVYIAILMSLAVLLYILYKVLPRDRVTHNLKAKIPEKVRYRTLLFIGLGASVAVGMVVYKMFGSASLAISVAALPLLIPGFYARRVEKKIREIESFFSIFIRSFGLTYAMVPHAPSALASTLRSGYGPLTKYLRRLLARLNAGIDPKIAWYHFISETWSEVVRRNVNILYDAMNVGGDLAKVGTVLSETIFKLLDIRKQRTQMAKAFESTVYIIHTLFTAILSFVLSLMNIFNQVVSKLQGINPQIASVLPFHPMSLQLIFQVSPIFIIILSIVNALAIKIAQGGMYETLWVPLALLMAIGGIVMYGVSMLAQSVFANVIGLSQLMSTLPKQVPP